jgi:S1-C subfamily serine protease
MMRRVGIFVSGATTAIVLQKIYSSEFQSSKHIPSPEVAIILADIKEPIATPISDKLRKDVSSLFRGKSKDSSPKTRSNNGANFIADAVESVLDKVVNIVAPLEAPPPGFLRRNYGGASPDQSETTGSGFFVDESGILMSLLP